MRHCLTAKLCLASTLPCPICFAQGRSQIILSPRAGREIYFARAAASLTIWKALATGRAALCDGGVQFYKECPQAFAATQFSQLNTLKSRKDSRKVDDR